LPEKKLHLIEVFFFFFFLSLAGCQSCEELKKKPEIDLEVECLNVPTQARQLSLPSDDNQRQGG
jgi:hypothetical protein